MSDIPDDPKKIRERIRRYERGLQKEKQTFGSYNDGAGKRYFIGPLYLLLGDLEGALKAFQWFDTTFPDDSGEAGQSLCWALAAYRSGDRKEAIHRLTRAMLQSRYVIPRLLGEPIDGLTVSADSDELRLMELDWIPAQYFSSWAPDEREWASREYHGEELTALRNRHLEITRALEKEPVGPRRTQLVEELYGL